MLLGLGISHDAVVGDRYSRPLATMTAYLDGLAEAGVPLERTCLAALGPRMLELAATRTAGAHPYLVTPEHTATARGIVGDGLLAVEQTVALGTNLEAARESARAMLQLYAALPNYAGNWRRLGFSDEDISTLDDGLVDALVACGDTAAVATRLHEQRRAGADHVCVQVLTAAPEDFPRAAWRALAPADR
jgi:probable F420-dependent oxidoreductase